MTIEAVAGLRASQQLLERGIFASIHSRNA